MKKNYVVLVLDESGSMGSMRDEAMGAFNQQIKDLRKAAEADEIDVRVGLVKFNTNAEDPTIWDKPISKVANLKKSEYKPDGMTAMLDAVGLAIDKLTDLSDIDDEGTSVLVNIISDGHENNSKKYSYSDIAERIQKLQATGRWTFTYSGANQDLSVVSQKLNIPIGNTLEFAATSDGLQASTQARTLSFDSYYGALRKSKSVSVANFYSPPSKEQD